MLTKFWSVWDRFMHAATLAYCAGHMDLDTWRTCSGLYQANVNGDGDHDGR